MLFYTVIIYKSNKNTLKRWYIRSISNLNVFLVCFYLNHIKAAVAKGYSVFLNLSIYDFIIITLRLYMPNNVLLIQLYCFILYWRAAFVASKPQKNGFGSFSWGLDV